MYQAYVDKEDENEFRLFEDEKFVNPVTIDGGLYDPDDLYFEPSFTQL